MLKKKKVISPSGPWRKGTLPVVIKHISSFGEKRISKNTAHALISLRGWLCFALVCSCRGSKGNGGELCLCEKTDCGSNPLFIYLFLMSA